MLVTRDEAVRPIACSLNGGDMQERIAEWQALLSEVERREAVPGGLRLAFGQPAPLSEMARLAEAEQKCCAFFSRSEEHTSELQSPMRISYAVFCLKKKK